ncbi:phosphoprotein phosphatase [Podospora conica]|nr:phosphoprotein phosphatase [Schizothecium conicum]
MTKFLSTSSCKAVSPAILAPIRATRQLGKAHCLSTTPTNLCRHQTRPYSVPTGTPSTAPGNTKFTYSVAASYIAKGRHFRPSVHVFQFNPYHHVQAPKPQSKALRPESGQDAFFVSRLGPDPSEVALGVADGVGGWSESGVDSADVSHALCSYMAADAHDGKDSGITARQLMKQGYETVCHDPKIVAGGTTATVALLRKGGILEVANLGDSGYILLRLNGVYAASEPQTHAFNTPYQLSVVPPSVLRKASMFGGAPILDQPRDAEVTHHKLRHGDVLVVASDGVWDNLHTTNILQIVSRVMQDKGAWTMASADAGVEVAKDLEAITKVPDLKPSALKKTPELDALQSVLATQIVAAAKSASMNKTLESPFAKEVRKYYPHDPYSGGKVDDICVVVAVVSEAPAPAGPEA